MNALDQPISIVFESSVKPYFSPIGGAHLKKGAGEGNSNSALKELLQNQVQRKTGLGIDTNSIQKIHTHPRSKGGQIDYYRADVNARYGDYGNLLKDESGNPRVFALRALPEKWFKDRAPILEDSLQEVDRVVPKTGHSGHDAALRKLIGLYPMPKKPDLPAVNIDSTTAKLSAKIVESRKSIGDRLTRRRK